MGRNIGRVFFVACVTVMALGATSQVSAQVLTLDQAINEALKTNGSSQYGVPQARESAHRGS